jgi:hypothetical protein
MAVVGGIFYGLLTQAITLLLGFSSELAVIAAFVVFFFYLVSRFLLLFSGIHTPYYSREGKPSSMNLYENTYFRQTAQWVGKLYHDHDVALFVFLALLSTAFLISLITDLSGNRPIGNTMRNLFGSFIPHPDFQSLKRFCFQLSFLI